MVERLGFEADIYLTRLRLIGYIFLTKKPPEGGGTFESVQESSRLT